LRSGAGDREDDLGKKNRAGFYPCPARNLSAYEVIYLLLTSELPAQSLHPGQGQSQKGDGGAAIRHSARAGSERKSLLLTPASIGHVEIPSTRYCVGA
jgi:hypothetical protein